MKKLTITDHFTPRWNGYKLFPTKLVLYVCVFVVNAENHLLINILGDKAAGDVYWTIDNYLKDTTPVYRSRASYLQLFEAVDPFLEENHINHYLFDPMVIKEICTFLEPTQNIRLLSPYYTRDRNYSVPHGIMAIFWHEGNFIV